MRTLIGTSKGIFSITEGVVRQLLECRGVRHLVRLEHRVFAGTGAGLFVSDDLGESWWPAGMMEHEVWQIQSAGEDVLFAATQPAALFRSENAGTTWHEVTSFSNAPESEQWCIPVKPPLPGRARALVIHRDDPQCMWVGVEVGGIMSTTDGGDSWQLTLPGGNPDLHMICAHPDNPDVLYASTGYGRLDGVAEMVEGNAGVFRSDDAGASWHYAWKGITPRYSRPMCIDNHAPYPLTIASAPTAFSSFKDQQGAQAMLYRSEDGGDSWRSLCDKAHSPSPENFHGLSPDPRFPGGVIVGTDTGEVWQVSNDAQWTLLGSGMPAVLSIAAF